MDCQVFAGNASPSSLNNLGDHAPKYLGQLDYLAGRSIQERMVQDRISDQGRDTYFFCEHPPCFTLGKRVGSKDEDLIRKLGVQLGYSVYSCDRGGEITYHGPGQLMFYPVLSLRQRNLGVRDFVRLGLEAIKLSLREYGVESTVLTNPAGLWLKPDSGEARKIAHVGLRIVRGVTLHGFSVNLNCDLKIFSSFSVCGMGSVPVTSLAKELGIERTWYQGAEFSKILSKNYEFLLTEV